MFIRKHKYFEQAAEAEAPKAAGAPEAQPADSPADASPPPGTVISGTPDAAPAAPESPTAPESPAAPPQWLNAPADDWRETLAGDNKAKLNALRRYSTLKDALDAGFEAQQKIRKGEVSNGLPENPTDEQLAEWRAANGVPEAPDKYQLQLAEGMVLGSQDQRAMDAVRQVAHESGVSNETLSKLANAMLQGRQQEIEARQNQDGLDTQLKQTWGQDYQTNLNLVNAFVGQLPETVRESFMSARLADGKALFNSPEVMAYFSDVMRKVSPAATVVPNSNNPMQTINDEIKALEGKMGTPEWYKDTDAQARYQELVTARESLQNQ